MSTLTEGRSLARLIHEVHQIPDPLLRQRAAQVDLAFSEHSRVEPVMEHLYRLLQSLIINRGALAMRFNEVMQALPNTEGDGFSALAWEYRQERIAQRTVQVEQ